MRSVEIRSRKVEEWWRWGVVKVKVEIRTRKPGSFLHPHSGFR
jgi:hypothetical protein